MTAVASTTTTVAGARTSHVTTSSSPKPIKISTPSNTRGPLRARCQIAVPKGSRLLVNWPATSLVMVKLLEVINKSQKISLRKRVMRLILLRLLRRPWKNLFGCLNEYCRVINQRCILQRTTNSMGQTEYIEVVTPGLSEGATSLLTIPSTPCNTLIDAGLQVVLWVKVSINNSCSLK